MEMKLYKLNGDVSQENTFRFIDMAGAEKHHISGDDGGPKMMAGGRMDINAATMINNISLVSFSKVVAEMSTTKKTPTGGTELSKGI